MLELGTPSPDFRLLDPARGRHYQLDDFASNPLLVIFMCNHCPFVIHILKGLVEFAIQYQPRGLHIVAINSNDPEQYPADSPEKMIELVNFYRLPFAYLFDETQGVAKAFNAACTPDFFLFDNDRKLAYRGQFDGSRPRNDVPVSGADLRRATDQILQGQAPDQEQLPSLGCNIKWREQA